MMTALVGSSKGAVVGGGGGGGGCGGGGDAVGVVVVVTAGGRGRVGWRMGGGGFGFGGFGTRWARSNVPCVLQFITANYKISNGNGLEGKDDLLVLYADLKYRLYEIWTSVSSSYGSPIALFFCF